MLRPPRRAENDGIPAISTTCLDANAKFGCGLAALCKIGLAVFRGIGLTQAERRLLKLVALTDARIAHPDESND
jgi:hypothetical protein